MTTTAQTQGLEDWLRDNGGYLNHAIRVCHSSEQGAHWRADIALNPQTPVCMVPHSLALSYLNALVDDTFPVFRIRRTHFAVENLGFFYLMTQYVNRAKSFWKPYLDLLPSPDSELLTPLWFEQAEDLAWLEGTDVLYTAQGRNEVYQRYFSSGVEILREAGIDVSPYTWNLFKWAVTMFTSRSFSSRAIAPSESKYWSAYKTGAEGRRQAVLMDMSHVSAEDLDFPVLFPGMDIGNHKQDAHVEWSYNPGRFSMVTHEAHAVGEEIFNNYGMDKSNSELLMGYGFCIPANPNDAVLVTLKAPPEDLQRKIREYHPGYFFADGTWNGPKATFHLKGIDEGRHTAEQIFRSIPGPLLELLLYMLRYECGQAFEFIENPYEYLTDTTSPGRRCLPFVARSVVQSLAPKLSRLQNTTLPPTPQNARQSLASVYRTGQVRIMDSTVAALKSFTRSYLIPATQSGPRFVTLEGLLQVWAGRAEVSVVGEFLSGIEANAGTYDITQLRGAGWEEDVTCLLLCALYLTAPEGDGGQWIRDMLPPDIDTTAFPLDEAGVEVQSGLMDLVRSSAAALPGSLWSDDRWSERLVTGLGGRMLQQETMMMGIRDETTGKEEARLVLYLHMN